MRSSGAYIALVTLALVACARGGMSTQEMEAAAIDRARQDLNVPANVPLQAQVWAGDKWQGKVVLCGIVSGGQVAQRFAATADDPPRWLLWEDAATPTPPARPDAFVSWAETCAGRTRKRELGNAADS